MTYLEYPHAIYHPCRYPGAAPALPPAAPRPDGQTDARPSMSDRPSPGGDPEGGAPDVPEEQPPCAELKAALEKCVREKGEQSCKELLESYHECLRALGIKV